jgi:hypothetical protein
MRTALETIARRRLAQLGMWILLLALATGCAQFLGPSPTPFATVTAVPSPSATVPLPTPVPPLPTAPVVTAPAPTSPPTAVSPGNASARRRIQFQPGGTTATVQGKTATPGDDRFAVRAQAGQTMSLSVTATQGPVILIVYGADGNVLMSDHAGASTFRGTLPTTQDYYVDTRSVGSDVVPFSLQVTIPPK